MARHRFVDYRVRMKGSPEVAYDPFIIMEMYSASKKDVDKKRAEKCARVYAFIVQTALRILPPKQKEIFYSVWVRNGGDMKKGVMEFSRKRGKSHFTSYNNFYKCVSSLKKYLEESGYAEHLVAYLLEDSGDDEIFF